MQKEASFPSDAGVEHLREFYRKWSETYDKDLNPDINWPCVPNLVKAFIASLGSEEKGARILDLGAGTGMLAIHLKKFGFTNIDALDASEPMLEKARERNLYKEYMCKLVTAEKLEIPTGSYDAIISCGTITGGYVQFDAFDEILRLVRPGGYICFTVRKDVYDLEEYGYAKKFEEFVAAGKWEIVHKEVSDYLKNGLENQRKCLIMCCKVLKNE